MKHSSKSTSRNWGLIIISSILFLGGSTLVVLAAINVASFGWWSLALGLSGLGTMGVAIMSIVTNDPAWILLDLILPN